MRTLSSDKRVAALAFDAAMVAFALILSFVESLVPLSIPLPGFKPGLANIVITAVFFTRSAKDAALVSSSRIIIIFLLFGNPLSLALSLSGAALSLTSLLILSALRVQSRLSYIGLSLTSALAHNIGQLIAASVTVGASVLSYFPALIIASLIYGTLSGVILNLLPTKILK